MIREDELPVKLLSNFPLDLVKPEAVLVPAKAGDAGCDLYAAEDVVLAPGQRVTIPTGIALAVPEGMELQVRPRSGLAHKLGLTVVNSPGTVDSGYRGEIMVIALNTQPAFTDAVMDKLLDVLDDTGEASDLSDTYDMVRGQNTIRIKRGERVAQVVLARFVPIWPVIVGELPDSQRGTAGLGSTGV